MAEGLFRHAVRNRPDIEIASAGVAAGYGQRPSENGVEALGNGTSISADFVRNR